MCAVSTGRETNVEWICVDGKNSHNKCSTWTRGITKPRLHTRIAQVLWVVSAWLACGYGCWRRKDAIWKTAQWRTLILEFKLHCMSQSLQSTMFRPKLFVELECAQDPGLSHPAFLNVCASRPRSERSTSILLGGGSNHASPWDAHDKVLPCYEMVWWYYDKIIQDSYQGENVESTLTMETTMSPTMNGLRGSGRVLVEGYTHLPLRWSSGPHQILEVNISEKTHL